VKQEFFWRIEVLCLRETRKALSHGLSKPAEPACQPILVILGEGACFLAPDEFDFGARNLGFAQRVILEMGRSQVSKSARPGAPDS